MLHNQSVTQCLQPCSTCCVEEPNMSHPETVASKRGGMEQFLWFPAAAAVGFKWTLLWGRTEKAITAFSFTACACVLQWAELVENEDDEEEMKVTERKGRVNKRSSKKNGMNSNEPEKMKIKNTSIEGKPSREITRWSEQKNKMAQFPLIPCSFKCSQSNTSQYDLGDIAAGHHVPISAFRLLTLRKAEPAACAEGNTNPTGSRLQVEILWDEQWLSVRKKAKMTVNLTPRQLMDHPTLAGTGLPVQRVTRWRRLRNEEFTPLVLLLKRQWLSAQVLLFIRPKIWFCAVKWCYRKVRS